MPCNVAARGTAGSTGSAPRGIACQLQPIRSVPAKRRHPPSRLSPTPCPPGHCPPALQQRTATFCSRVYGNVLRGFCWPPWAHGAAAASLRVALGLQPAQPNCTTSTFGLACTGGSAQLAAGMSAPLAGIARSRRQDINLEMEPGKQDQIGDFLVRLHHKCNTDVQQPDMQASRLACMGQTMCEQNACPGSLSLCALYLMFIDIPECTQCTDIFEKCKRANPTSKHICTAAAAASKTCPTRAGHQPAPNPVLS